MANLMTTYTQSTLKNTPTTLDPNKFALPGCTFMGWSTDKENAVYVDGDTVAFDGDTTLYAVWARAQCTITFDANGGTGSTTADREYGSPLNLPETSRDGYTLVGWFTQVVDGKQVSSSTIVTGDATYYAVWETNNYDTIRVHFDAQGGTVELQQKDVLRGQPIGELPTSTREKPDGLAGMEFDGWWTEIEGGSRCVESDIVPDETPEITLYAHWIGVIHYDVLNMNAPEGKRCVVDPTGIASGFYGNGIDRIQCSLATIDEDKFDFSGEFQVVIKCKKTYDRTDYNRGYEGHDSARCDVFARYVLENNLDNHLLDFGILDVNIGTGNSLYTQWEIASNDPVDPIIGNSHEINQPFFLGVQRLRNGSGWSVLTWYSTDGLNWTKECENNNSWPTLVPGRISIGIDADSPTEYFPGEIYLNECYLIQRNTDSAQGCGKYIFRRNTRCKITFDPNGGTCSSSEKNVNWGQSVGELPSAACASEPGFAGMEFQGWYTARDGGTIVTSQTVVPENLNEITLYAHWLGVIRYRIENNYDNNVVTIDNNHAASGFKGQVSTGKYCAIRAIDKFDFSGNFTIVMKGKAALAASRQDMFAGHNQDGQANLFMDFGLNGQSPQWEIAKYIDGATTTASPLNISFSANEVFLLKVVRRTEEQNQIKCYWSADNGQTWNLDYENTGNGSTQPGTFWIGIDPDSHGEYFRGSIYLDECYLVQENGNQTNQPCGKYVLRPEN